MDFTKSATTVSLLTLAIGLAVNGYSQSFLTNGLVAYYPFNGNANDASGNGHNGTVYGATLTTDRFGNPNSAYYFDGVSSYISVPLTNTLFRTNFTASVWFNAFNVLTGWPALLNEQNQGFLLEITGPNCGCSDPESLVAFSESGPGGTATWQNWRLNPSQATPTNTWRQVVVSMSGLTVQMFVNGQLVQTNPVHGSTMTSGQYLTVGGAYTMIPGDAFQGVIDDVRFYNRALSTNEVQQLYAFEWQPTVTIKKAIKPSFSNLYLGTNYQLQVSRDLINWTNQGSPFMPTNSLMDYPQYFDVDNWNSLFFRVQTSP